MDATQKCPECRSLLETTHEYECGTTVDDEGNIVRQSPQCEFRVTQHLRDEVARLDAENADLRDERDKLKERVDVLRSSLAEANRLIKGLKPDSRAAVWIDMILEEA